MLEKQSKCLDISTVTITKGLEIQMEGLSESLNVNMLADYYISMREKNNGKLFQEDSHSRNSASEETTNEGVQVVKNEPKTDIVEAEVISLD